jgi:hypothetical protein
MIIVWKVHSLLLNFQGFYWSIEFPDIQLPAKCKTLAARIKEYMKVQSAQGKALQTSVSGLSDVVLFHNKQPVSWTEKSGNAWKLTQ